MKKLLFVLFCLIGLVACGADTAPGEENRDCWSDNECERTFSCIDGKCIEKAECANDLDCAGGDHSVCINYKCRPLGEKDPCYNKECGDSTKECPNCGYLTSCNGTTCKLACDYMYEIINNIIAEHCDTYTGDCNRCNCWKQGYYTDGGSCGRLVSDIKECYESNAIEDKEQIEVTGLDEIGPGIDKECN